jgi:hypothetical protein
VGLIFAGGFVVGNRLPPVTSFGIGGGPDAALRSPEASAKPKEELSPREEALRMLARLGEQVRLLLGRREMLETAAQETRIAYQLMRSHGYDEDSDECQRLASRRRRLEQQLGEVNQLLEDTRQVEARLQQAADQLSHSDRTGSADVGCLREARTFLRLREVADLEGRPIIPDSRWAGESDRARKDAEAGGESKR